MTVTVDNIKITYSGKYVEPLFLDLDFAFFNMSSVRIVGKKHPKFIFKFILLPVIYQHL